MGAEMVRVGDIAEHEIEKIGPANHRLDVSLVAQRRESIVELMRNCMIDGVDYGVIPGSPKPTLMQPGAQKIVNLFQLDAEPEPMPDSVLEPNFILHSYKCTLYSIETGKRVGSGAGSCNSREEKYGMRTVKRLCPICGKSAIIKGKKEYGGGYICWQKAGKSDGCGAKFLDGDPAIESQPEGKTANENIWEQENTIRKMAIKRALICAVLNTTAAGDLFTQDIEDMAEFQGKDEPAKPHHREGNEHFSTFCKDCLAAGVPKELMAVLSKGRIYVRTKDGDPIHDVYPLDKQPRETPQEAPGRDLQPPTKKEAGQTFKEWLESMAEAKKAVGEDNYYRILKDTCKFAYKHANEIKTVKDQKAIRRAMTDCYRMMRKAQPAHGIDAFVADMALWRGKLGDRTYYLLMGTAGYEKAEDVPEEHRGPLKKAMLDALADQEKAKTAALDKLQYPD